MHVPPRYEAVRDLMPAFFTLLKEEKRHLKKHHKNRPATACS